ncbi:Cystathionine beta-lyase protein [Dioscorea alata]|uniref:Cystathionine beta-lyase protein n=1 Tax=Dioscorea alata TaxID=55571 RepID=A0ACB7USG5_DIOAL|nr:Cystathionine beta-lyase protein [Dioscorea alata]
MQKIADLDDREPSVATILANFTNDFYSYHATSTPLYQTTTFNFILSFLLNYIWLILQLSTIEFGSYDYTRSGNLTRDVLQSLTTKLEKVDSVFCFNSGMAALEIVTDLLEFGQEIVSEEDLYGESNRFLSKVVPKKGIVVLRVKTSDFSVVASAIGSHTKLKILEIAHSHGALVLVDNSILSPILCQPLKLGAGMSAKIAEFLSSHTRVKKVNYLGLPSHPGHKLQFRMTVNNYALSKHIAENTKYFSITVSYGGVNSLISLPYFMSHASIPAEELEAKGLTKDLVRISVGIEDVGDLIAALDDSITSAPK